MFKLQENPTFKHAVEVLVPVDGGHDVQSFAATFRVVKDDEIEDYDTQTAAGLKNWLRRIVVELHDIADDQDRPIAHSDELMTDILSYPYTRMGLLKAYRKGMTGAKTGN